METVLKNYIAQKHQDQSVKRIFKVMTDEAEKIVKTSYSLGWYSEITNYLDTHSIENKHDLNDIDLVKMFSDFLEINDNK